MAGAHDLRRRPYDLVTTFDCLHDMGDPVGAARHIRDQTRRRRHLADRRAGCRRHRRRRTSTRSGGCSTRSARSSACPTRSRRAAPHPGRPGRRGGDPSGVAGGRLHPVPPRRRDTVQPHLRGTAVVGAASSTPSRPPPQTQARRTLGPSVCDGSWAPRSSTASPCKGSRWPTRCVASSQVVNAYATATVTARGGRRWDFEEESPLRDARGFDMSRQRRRIPPSRPTRTSAWPRHPHQRRPALRRPRPPGVLHARGHHPARRGALGQGRRAGDARRLQAGRGGCRAARRSCSTRTTPTTRARPTAPTRTT